MHDSKRELLRTKLVVVPPLKNPLHANTKDVRLLSKNGQRFKKNLIAREDDDEDETILICKLGIISSIAPPPFPQVLPIPRRRHLGDC